MDVQSHIRKHPIEEGEKGLDAEQLQVLKEVEDLAQRYHIVTGPPGSGKTHVLTALVVNLLQATSAQNTVCCFSADNISADYAANAVLKARPDNLRHKRLLRIGLREADTLAAVHKMRWHEHYEMSPEDLARLSDRPYPNVQDEMSQLDVSSFLAEDDEFHEQFKEARKQGLSPAESLKVVQRKSFETERNVVAPHLVGAYQIWETHMAISVGTDLGSRADLSS